MPFTSKTGRLAGKKGGAVKCQRTLDKEIIRNYIVEETLKNKIPIYKALITEALKGNIPAIKELLDRVLGKSVQPIGNDEDKPFKLEKIDTSKLSNEEILTIILERING